MNHTTDKKVNPSLEFTKTNGASNVVSTTKTKRGSIIRRFANWCMGRDTVALKRKRRQSSTPGQPPQSQTKRVVQGPTVPNESQKAALSSPGFFSRRLQSMERRYKAHKYGAREVALVFTAGCALYMGYYSVQTGVNIIGVGILPIFPIASLLGTLAGGTYALLRLTVNFTRILFWPQIYFLAKDKHAYQLRARYAPQSAPQPAHFNRGARFIAFKWDYKPWDLPQWKIDNPNIASDTVAQKKAKTIHELMVSRYTHLPDISNDLFIHFGNYVKHNIKLKDTPLGGGWKWATREYFVEFSPSRLARLTEQPQQKRKARRGEDQLDENIAGDAVRIIGELRYQNPKSMTPATFYVRLTNQVIERALTPAEDSQRLSALQKLQWSAGLIMIGAVLMMYLLGSGQPTERTTATPVGTPNAVQQAQHTLSATATAFAMEQEEITPTPDPEEPSVTPALKSETSNGR